MAIHIKILLDKARESNDETAVKIYRQILDEEPTNDEAHFNIGLIYKRQRDGNARFTTINNPPNTTRIFKARGGISVSPQRCSKNGASPDALGIILG